MHPKPCATRRASKAYSLHHPGLYLEPAPTFGLYRIRVCLDIGKALQSNDRDKLYILATGPTKLARQSGWEKGFPAHLAHVRELRLRCVQVGDELRQLAILDGQLLFKRATRCGLLSGDGKN